VTSLGPNLPPADPAAARDLAGALRPDEHVLWAGRPDERHYAKTDYRLIALGVFWVLVSGAGFWGFTVTTLSGEYAGVSVPARAALLLVAAAPCALIMSTPVAVAAAIGKGGKNGVLIKGGVALENLGKLKAVAFYGYPLWFVTIKRFQPSPFVTVRRS